VKGFLDDGIGRGVKGVTVVRSLLSLVFWKRRGGNEGDGVGDA
jgi:hypothetical protein